MTFKGQKRSFKKIIEFGEIGACTIFEFGEMKPGQKAFGKMESNIFRKMGTLDWGRLKRPACTVAIKKSHTNNLMPDGGRL